MGTTQGILARTQWVEEQAQAPQERMHRIFGAGGLVGERTYGTFGEVICFSELSWTAVSHQLTSGFTGYRRGPYAPWALGLSKEILVRDPWKARPVFYMSDGDLSHMGAAPIALQDRCVRSVPGQPNNDWTHEREWRMCRGDGPPMPANTPWGFPFGTGALSWLIVGISGWEPRAIHASIRGLPPVPRYLWSGAGLISDGHLVL